MSKQFQINHSIKSILKLGISLCLAGLTLIQNAALPVVAKTLASDDTVNSGNGIEFKLGESAGVYTVYMRPNATPAAPNATISAQVTIKFPHGAATPTEITSLVNETTWDLTSRNDAPAEAPTADYLSFSLDFPTGAYRAFNWAANTEQAVFSFKAAAGGHLIDNCDSFAMPNSQSAAVGNEITLLGIGDGSTNSYLANYAQTADCPSAIDAVSAVALQAHTTATDTLSAGGLVTYTFQVSNDGLRTANDLTLEVALTGLADMRSASNSFGVANSVLYPNQSATWHLGELAPNANGILTLTLATPMSNVVLTTSAQISATNDNTTTDNAAELVVAVLVATPKSVNYATYMPLIVR